MAGEKVYLHRFPLGVPFRWIASPRSGPVKPRLYQLSHDSAGTGGSIAMLSIARVKNAGGLG